MTETTFTQPTDDAPNETPADLLLTLIAALLAPMFRTVSGTDIAFAREAALQTVNAYRARSQTDLITVAQIVACGLTAVGSLGLSMADGLSLSMVLRLRGNAVALNRAAEQSRRALAASQATVPITPPDPVYEATVQAKVAASQKLTAEAMIRLQKPEPPVAEPQTTPAQPEAAPVLIAMPKIAPSAGLTVSPPISDREWEIRLAGAMSEVAAEYTANVATLPPADRALASRRAALLSSAATDVILGKIPPKMKPGDLTALMRTNPLRP